MQQTRLDYLFNAHFNKTATAREKEELMELWADAKNDIALQKLMTEAWLQLGKQPEVFLPEEVEQLFEGITSSGGKAIGSSAHLLPRRGRRWVAIASILLSLLATIYWLRSKHNNQTGLVADRIMVRQPDIAPGGNRASLTLADGSVIVLDSFQNGLLAQQKGIQVVKTQDGSLTYTGQASGEIAYNQLSTPRGGQYNVTLPDGSRAWLNSASSLRYPTAFSTNERKVTLSGEGYFEVAHNGTPFMVEVIKNGIPFTVNVLGTHFNVMAYDNENSADVTLLEGAVNIVNRTSTHILQPGQQGKLEENRAINVTSADIEEVMAWKNGSFLFKKYSIEKIVRQLARWYSVEVEYANGIPTKHFSGIVDRHNNISQVLKILEAGGIRCRIEGQKLLIRS